MELSHILPFEETINEELTRQVQNDPCFSLYKQWLSDNGCLFPSLEFPVAFGEYGIVGTSAKTNISSLKAFLFVPYQIIISPKKAFQSEIGFILQKHDVFKTHKKSNDFVLWAFLMFEKLKGDQSFWHPYFRIIPEIELLMDWSNLELSELQDKFLANKAKLGLKECLSYYKLIKPILVTYPEYFPGSLKETFIWAFKVSNTRAFNHDEGIIVPMADNLNHDDVYIDYLSLSKEFLQAKSQEIDLLKDYRDFDTNPHTSNGPMNARTHFNRLEKYSKWFNDSGFEGCRSVWELSELFENLESSSDEEELMNCSGTTEEDSEEEDSEEEAQYNYEFNPSEKYFVIRAGEDGSFKQGKQVFNCYGRLNNFDLLIDYGFALLPNRYDSVFLRLYIKDKNKLDHLKKLSEIVETYYIKYNKLNLDYLMHIRKLIYKNSEYPNLETAVTVEQAVVKHAKNILEDFMNNYPTTLSYDEELLKTQLGPRHKTALKYRISQKRIVAKQLELLQRLTGILNKVSQGQTVEEAHWPQATIQTAMETYPLREYLFNLKHLSIFDK